MTEAQRQLVACIESLDAQDRVHVESFIDRLLRERTSSEDAHAAKAMSEPTFRAVWENPEDDVYDAL